MAVRGLPHISTAGVRQPTKTGNYMFPAAQGSLIVSMPKPEKLIWQENVIEKYHGEIYKHGDAECPALTENAVLFTTGGEKYARSTR